MSDPIRTPEDEVERPGYFLPPFAPGRNYQGTTYGRRIEGGKTLPGHSDFSVDFNRRTPTGGWIDDTGDPVLAAADGTVAEVDRADGLVVLEHRGGYSTEYRHMTGIGHKVGDRVERGDRIGSIGNVAGSGASFGAHLHHVHFKDGKRIRMRFEDRPLAVSVDDSSTRAVGWDAPDAVNVIGPPPKATWQSAYREAAQGIAKRDDTIAEIKGLLAAVREERDDAKRRIGELEAQAPADCSAIQDALDAETERAAAFEERLARIREIAA